VGMATSRDRSRSLTRPWINGERGAGPGGAGPEPWPRTMTAGLPAGCHCRWPARRIRAASLPVAGAVQGPAGVFPVVGPGRSLKSRSGRPASSCSGFNDGAHRGGRDHPGRTRRASVRGGRPARGGWHPGPVNPPLLPLGDPSPSPCGGPRSVRTRLAEPLNQTGGGRRGYGPRALVRSFAPWPPDPGIHPEVGLFGLTLCFNNQSTFLCKAKY